jgi:hypothetical protein
MPAATVMRIAVVGLWAVAAAGQARADNPCTADVGRFCDSSPPLEQLSCLQAHRADLSQACRDRVERTVVELQEARQDCEPDAFAFCHDAGPGEPMVRCLSARQGQLSRRCQAVFDGFARREAAAKAACVSEASRYCQDVKPGKGDVVVCLLFRGRDLSSGCRAALGR